MSSTRPASEAMAQVSNHPSAMTPGASPAGQIAHSQMPATTTNRTANGFATDTSIRGYQMIPLTSTSADATSPTPLTIASAFGLLIIDSASPAPMTSGSPAPPGVDEPNR